MIYLFHAPYGFDEWLYQQSSSFQHVSMHCNGWVCKKQNLLIWYNNMSICSPAAAYHPPHPQQSVTQSSTTLTCNVAKWFWVQVFKLNKMGMYWNIVMRRERGLAGVCAKWPYVRWERVCRYLRSGQWPSSRQLSSQPELSHIHPARHFPPSIVSPRAQCQQNGGILIIIFQIHFKTDKLLQSVSHFFVPNFKHCRLQLSLVFILYFVVQNVAIHDCWVELFILHHLLY